MYLFGASGHGKVIKEILNAAKSIQKGERASLATEYTTGHLKREVL